MSKWIYTVTIDNSSNLEKIAISCHINKNKELLEHHHHTVVVLDAGSNNNNKPTQAGQD